MFQDDDAGRGQRKAPTARNSVILLDPDPNSRLEQKTVLMDHDYEVASLMSPEGALSLLERCQHDLLVVNGAELLSALPSMFESLATRHKPMAIVVCTDRPRSTMQTIPALAMGKIGRHHAKLLVQPVPGAELLAALRELKRQLRVRRATGELEAMSVGAQPSDSGAWR